MDNKLSLGYNVEGRIERSPLGVISYILNIIGIIGNAVVIHIFRTRTGPSSNYRIFVLFLSVVDLSLCISHIAKELSRMISVYHEVTGTNLTCKISNYIGNSVGMASLLIVVFIGFERYRKICTPFKSQITTTHSKIMCLSVICIGFVLQFPIYLFHGKRYVQVENINATRCSIENKYDESLLTLIYYNFVFLAAITGVILVVVFQVNIRNALVEKSKTKRRMKARAEKQSSGEDQTECSNRKVDGKKTNQTLSNTSAADQEAEKNKRIAITFAFVTVFLVASFITITLFQTIRTTQNYFFPREKISKIEDIVDSYMPDIVVINGILNPFVYFFTDAQFKTEVMKLCGRV
ncbi:nematocin receptor 2-like [Saccostrea cucullata]|uniref:nematocin receptor 2-like n=1 Tax=Saccostrea cuccullata TaxID=36930 RepID=UPI002ED5613F